MKTLEVESHSFDDSGYLLRGSHSAKETIRRGSFHYHEYENGLFDHTDHNYLPQSRHLITGVDHSRRMKKFSHRFHLSRRRSSACR